MICIKCGMEDFQAVTLQLTQYLTGLRMPEDESRLVDWRIACGQPKSSDVIQLFFSVGRKNLGDKRRPAPVMQSKGRARSNWSRELFCRRIVTTRIRSARSKRVNESPR